MGTMEPWDENHTKPTAPVAVEPNYGKTYILPPCHPSYPSSLPPPLGDWTILWKRETPIYTHYPSPTRKPHPLTQNF